MGLFQGAYRLLTNSVAVDVAVVDGNGDQLTGFDGSRPANSTITSVGSSIASVTLAAANAARRQLVIQNNSTKVLYIAFAATATSSAYTVKLAAGGVYESPLNGYTGIVTGIWAAVNGNAIVTEVTT